ncbi:MAG: tetratricopeptide repeat protein [Alphaproteobacteria bacterium]
MSEPMKSAEAIIAEAETALASGDNREAIALFRKAIGLDKTVAKWHAMLGKSLMRSEIWATARDSFNNAIRIDPEVSYYHHSLGLIYSELGDFDMAEKSLSKALQMSPELDASQAALGRLYEKKEDYEAALVSYDLAIKLASKVPHYYAERAEVLLSLGRNAEAAASYQSGLKLAPDRASWWFKLSQAFLSAKRSDEAVSAAEKALKLDPESTAMQDALDIARGRHPNFAKTLFARDGKKECQRLYIAGCGRSGTWLLENSMSGFDDCARDPRERHFGHFSQIESENSLHILKRNARSFEDVQWLPLSIGLLYIVRHPFDVLTSRHIDIEYYITPDRWLNEIRALQAVMDRPNMMVLRYEDLVAKPNDVQDKIEKRWELKATRSFAEFMENANPTEHVKKAMSGIRAMDSSRIKRYLKDPEHVAYCKKIAPSLEAELRWVQNQFGYEYPKEIIDLSRKP